LVPAEIQNGVCS